MAGAFVAALLWTVLRVGYTIYVTEIAHFEDLFGPLAAIITLLVFIYFASVVLLLGAEVARANLIEPASTAKRGAAVSRSRRPPGGIGVVGVVHSGRVTGRVPARSMA